jgi:hypothetical protein
VRKLLPGAKKFDGQEYKLLTTVGAVVGPLSLSKDRAEAKKLARDIRKAGRYYVRVSTEKIGGAMGSEEVSHARYDENQGAHLRCL